MTFTFGNFFNATLSEQEVVADKVNYVISNNGEVFEVRETDLGRFTAPTKKVLGAQKVEASFVPKLQKKIPFELLNQIVQFFKDVSEEINEHEAMIQVFYDVKKEEYFLHCPIQRTSKTLVSYTQNPEYTASPDYIYVMDIHSHNTMNAFFSGTDDANEQETRLYGVVGRVDKATPDILFRGSCQGNFFPLEMSEVIEMPTVSLKNMDFQLTEENIFFPTLTKEQYPSEWMEIVLQGVEQSKLEEQALLEAEKVDQSTAGKDPVEDAFVQLESELQFVALEYGLDKKDVKKLMEKLGKSTDEFDFDATSNAVHTEDLF